MEASDDSFTPLQPGDGYDDEPLPRPKFQIPQPSAYEDPLEGNSPMDETIDGLAPKAREKVLRLAREKGFPDDDILFQLTALIREHDGRYTAAAEKLVAAAGSMENAISDGPDKIRAAYETLVSSTTQLQENDVATKAILEEAKKSYAWTKKVLLACACLLGFSFFINVGAIGTVIKARGSVDALNAQRVETAETNALSLRVIKLAWARMLLDGGRSTIKREYLDLSHKESLGQLTQADLAYRDNLKAGWGKLDIEEAQLREEETALKYELNQRGK